MPKNIWPKDQKQILFLESGLDREIKSLLLHVQENKKCWPKSNKRTSSVRQVKLANKIYTVTKTLDLSLRFPRSRSAAAKVINFIQLSASLRLYKVTANRNCNRQHTTLKRARIIKPVSRAKRIKIKETKGLKQRKAGDCQLML